jgi:tryptophanyl-tRNA synthetase
LERAHSFKDKKAKGIAANHGLFAYPVLMAADILLYQADLIPVGKDQKQHVEMTRDIAIRFNQTYGDTFNVPAPEIPKDVATVPGVDGQKMSKSYGNTIDIFCSYEELQKKVMSIVTDATPVQEPKNPDKCTLFALYSLFLDKNGKKALKERYLKPGLKYSDVKKELLQIIWNYFTPFRDKRNELMTDREKVLKIMKMGAEKARAVATVTLNKVRQNVGLNY